MSISLVLLFPAATGAVGWASGSHAATLPASRNMRSPPYPLTDISSSAIALHFPEVQSGQLAPTSRSSPGDHSPGAGLTALAERGEPGEAFVVGHGRAPSWSRIAAEMYVAVTRERNWMMA